MAEGIILEVTVKKRHNLEPGLESKPQETSFRRYVYRLPRSWDLLNDEKVDEKIKKAFPGAERES